MFEILRHIDHERPFDGALADPVLDERRLAPGSTSLAKVSLSSFPSARSPRSFWKAMIACRAFSADFPSISPGEKFARSSRISARSRTALGALLAVDFGETCA
jgi:hypothetical protein